MLIIYTKEGCPWCDEVKVYLNKRGIEFEEKEVLANPEYFKEMVDKSGQEKAPTLDLDGKILPDAGVEEVEEFLK